MICLRRWIERPKLAYSEALVAEAITSALQQLFGCVGGAVLFEVLDCDGTTGRSQIAIGRRRVRWS